MAAFGLKVKLSAYAMPMLVFGIVLVFQKSKNLKGIGYVLAGLGFLFLGISYMKSGFDSFKDTIDLTRFAMTGIGGLLVFTGIGVFATVVMQSSHATLMLILAGLAAGQVTYANALALAIGANIGTTITAILGALSSNHQGRRLAGAHLVFNLVTGAIAIVFIQPFIWAVDGFASAVGIAPDDYTLKLAVFHTLFNVVGVLVMMPAVNPLVAMLRRVIPEPIDLSERPKYLTDAAFDFPETLLGAVRREILHLYDSAFEIMAHGLNLHRTDIQSDIALESVVKPDDTVMHIDLDAVYVTNVKGLYAAIIEFISRAQTKLPSEYAQRLFEFRNACHAIVGGVKEIKHLRRNLEIFARSDNPDIRAAYRTIRLMLAKLFRDIHRMREVPILERDVLALDVYKRMADEENVIADGTMDRLIREGRITSHMATSLMNDVGYARDVVWNLVDMAEAVLGAIDTDVTSTGIPDRTGRRSGGRCRGRRQC